MWRRLPNANPGDPFETPLDRQELMWSSPISYTRWAAFAVLVGLAILLAGLLSLTSREVLPNSKIALFLPGLFSGVFGVIALQLWQRWFPPPRRLGRRCVACGYDLRGVSGGRCPECGRSSEAAADAAQSFEHKDPQR